MFCKYVEALSVNMPWSQSYMRRSETELMPSVSRRSPSLAVRDDIRPAEVCRLYWPYCRIFVSLSDISKERYARLPVALAKANGYLCGLTFQKMPYLLIFSTGAMAPAFFWGRQTVSPSLSWCAFSFPYPRSSTLRMLPL